MQRIDGFIWEEWIVDKLDWKHRVDPDEVEEVFFTRSRKIRRSSDEKYLLFGQTYDGRYLFIVFVWVESFVKVISARDMTTAERRYFGK